jgi:ACS family hexuronate transporter-like MFS transporter
VAVIAVSVRHALAIDAEQFGWLAGSFSAAYLLAAPVAGRVLDGVGARRGLPVAVGVWSVIAAAHALAPSFAVLLSMRVALGVAEAPSFPGAVQSVRRTLPAGDRSAAFGLLFTGSSVGAAVAGPLAIGLDARLGWRAAFALTSLLGTAWVPLWIVVTRPAAVRAALASSGKSEELRSVRPRIATDPAVLRAVVLVFVSAPVLMFVLIWSPQYFALAHGASPASVARVVWLPPVMLDAGLAGFGLLASWLDRARPPRSHVPLAIVAGAMGSSLIWVTRVHGTWPAAILLGVAAAGAGGLYTLLTAEMMARIDPALISTAGGLTAAAQSLAYVLLNPAVGRWVDRTQSFDGPLVAIGAIVLPGTLAWVLWPTPTALAKSMSSRASHR